MQENQIGLRNAKDRKKNDEEKVATGTTNDETKVATSSEHSGSMERKMSRNRKIKIKLFSRRQK